METESQILDLVTCSDEPDYVEKVKPVEIDDVDGLIMVRAESVDTNYSDYEDHFGITIDWLKEEAILERKRKVTMLVIMLAFLVTTAVMVMSVAHVERNKLMKFSCPENNTACIQLLCQWEARGEDDGQDCDEVVGDQDHDHDASYQELNGTEEADPQQKEQ